MDQDGQRDEYYLVHRKDGRISPIKAQTAKQSFANAYRDGKVKMISPSFSPDEYDLVRQAAEADGMTVTTWAAKKLVEIAKRVLT